MKQCPICKTRYTDDTLQYCLQDGTPLTAPFDEGEFPSETETVISRRTKEQTAEPTFVGGRPTFEPPPAKRSNTAAVVLFTAFTTLIIVAFVAAGVFLYLRQRAKDDARFTPDKDTSNAFPPPSTTPTPKPSATPSPTPSPTPSRSPVNKDAITEEISDEVSNWADETNSADVDRLMQSYADTVDYYKSGSVGREVVRRDKARALSNYDSIDVEIDNLKVSVDDSGEAATAEFDKTWEFVGEETYQGRARSQLRFRKIADNWRIVAEKDIKVY